MTRPIVLLMATYPVARPLHGGQIRMAAIARAYREAGWDAVTLSVYAAEEYPADEAGPLDLTFPADSPYRLYRGRRVTYINDFLAGRFAVADDGGWPDVRTRLPAKIDAVHVEQPWLWDLAVKIRNCPTHSRARLVYGSQNVEAPLKAGIFEQARMLDVDDVVADIAELERRAAQESDLAVAVTSADQALLAAWGARWLALAPNGIEPWNADPERIEFWREKLPAQPWPLFVGSAHPPNITGFAECVGDALGCIPPGSRLVVAGGVCQGIRSLLERSRWRELNRPRVQFLSILSDEDLAAVKQLTHAYLLPILHGGGSNIKTAEALFSGRHVVGALPAFRGYEGFRDAPGVTVCEDRPAMRAALRRILTSPGLDPHPAWDARRASLQWSACLTPITAALASQPTRAA